MTKNIFHKIGDAYNKVCVGFETAKTALPLAAELEIGVCVLAVMPFAPAIPFGITASVLRITFFAAGSIYTAASR